ncbi:MAG: response regulator [Planctomycetes bacterium]|nr:response regulator [Planctomycetota bacterium]MCC7169852.1 response regulator [Planctomycetota bacterium]
MDDPVLGQLCEQMPLLFVDERTVIVSAGSGVAQMLAVPAHELVGQRLDHVLPPIEGSAPLRGLATGGERRFHPTPVAVQLGTGVAQGILLRDDTALERARAECVHLNKLAAAGRLVSSIVHEINNPLSGIIGYSQLLLVRDVDPDLRGSIEKIYSESLRASRIVRNLLDFARRRQPARGRVRLGQVIRKALELKSHDLRMHNVSVHLDLSEQLPTVNGDPHQLLQVFVNLITNAEHAMYAADRGGRIDIEAQCAGPLVSMVVRDTGPGIPAELRDRVFEPFFTTKGEGQGTGLGLTLARDLLAHYGATLALLNDGRPGAAFQLTFGASDDEVIDAPVDAPQRRRVRIRGRRFVVVEDDPVFRAMMVEALERHDNHVHPFDRSEPALRFLRTHGVDAIVSDLHRPGLNGLEFREEVKGIDAQLAERIVFLTGDMLNEDLQALAQRGDVEVLAKPVLLSTLFDALDRVLTASQGRQRTLFSPDGPAPGFQTSL